MTLHQTIKEQATEALRARDRVRLDTLRGLNALFTNELVTLGNSGEFLDDEKARALIKRSVKQRKDSIQQFENGGRIDLAQKERAELAILESFLPPPMGRDEIETVVKKHIDAMGFTRTSDRSSVGTLTGAIMKELSGKADGSLVKQVIDSLVS